MSALTTQLRKKFKSPEEALRQLGLDATVLNQETRKMKGKPTVFAARALMLTAANIAPFLAQDTALDLIPVFKPLKAAEPFDKAKFQGALDKALDGKLAHKVETSHIAELINGLHIALDGKDESASEEQKKAMEAAAKDKAKDEFPKNAMDAAKAMDWLKANDKKSYDAAMKACDMDPDDMEAEDEEEESEEDNYNQKSASGRAPGDKKGGKDKKAKDKAPGKDAKEEDDKDMGKDQFISQVAMDAALKTQAENLEKSITDRVNKQSRDKLAAVAVGEQKLGRFDHGAFDTAAQVKHGVLEALGNKQHKDIKEEIALDAMINLYPDVGTMRPTERPQGSRPMAMDAAAKTDLDTILGEDSGFKNIRVGV